MQLQQKSLTISPLPAHTHSSYTPFDRDNAQRKSPLILQGGHSQCSSIPYTVDRDLVLGVIMCHPCKVSQTRQGSHRRGWTCEAGSGMSCSLPTQLIRGTGAAPPQPGVTRYGVTYVLTYIGLRCTVVPLLCDH